MNWRELLEELRSPATHQASRSRGLRSRLRNSHVALTAVFGALLPANAFGQVAGTTLALVPIQSEASEITYDPDLIFEAKLAPHAFFRSPGGRLGIEVTPKVVIRILDDPSTPVRSPSFMPRATVYIARDVDWHRDSGESSTFYSLRISHHSNGQDGDFYEDGEINVVDGSFSTNFVEVGMHRVLPSVSVPLLGPSITILGASIEQHLWFGQTDELDGQYSDTRLHLHFDSYRSEGAGTVNFNGQLSYLGGELRGESLVAPERFIVDLQVQVRTPWFTTAGFYIGLYAGADYYNMRFSRHVLAPRFGLAFDFATWGPVG
jgi:hypothetical protein